MEHDEKSENDKTTANNITDVDFRETMVHFANQTLQPGLALPKRWRVYSDLAYEFLKEFFGSNYMEEYNIQRLDVLPPGWLQAPHFK